MDIDILRLIVRKKHKKLTNLSDEYGHDTPINFNLSIYSKIKRTISHIDKNMDIKKKQEMTIKNKSNEMEENIKLAKYFNVGYYIIAPLFIGVFLGLFLDSILKTKPFFILFFLLFGTVGSFYNIWKSIKE